MKTLDRITVTPETMNGQACIRGMRITVRRVLEAITLYRDWDRVIAEYPELEHEDIEQALAFAALSLDDEVITLAAA